MSQSQSPTGSSCTSNLFLLRPVTQLEAAGAPQEKLILFMYEDTEGEENVYIQNTSQAEKWVANLSNDSMVIAPRRYSGTYSRNSTALSSAFQWHNSTGMLRTNKYIAALNSTTVKRAIDELTASFDELKLKVEWVGSERPMWSEMDNKITIEFRLVRTPHRGPNGDNESEGDIYLLGDTKYIRSYAKLVLPRVGWQLVRTANDIYWYMSAKERMNTDYSYAGSFLAVLDKIEQATLTFSTKPDYRFMYFYSDAGNLERISDLEVPQPQLGNWRDAEHQPQMATPCTGTKPSLTGTPTAKKRRYLDWDKKSEK